MNDQQLLRYSRQIMLADFDVAGQQRLIDAKILLVGLGGLGCPIALYLAAAGVGELWLADHDEVELSNLQRQIAHGFADIDQPKVVSAKAAIEQINPEINTVCITEKLTGQLLTDTVAKVDLVIDATDNFSSRLEINRACVERKTPLVSGAAIRAEGQVIVFDAANDQSPCYRCLYDDGAGDELLSCAESGVLAPLVGVIGSMQALQAIKMISGFGEVLAGQLLVFDAKYMEWQSVQVQRLDNCPICSNH